ncbi:MAG: GspE/PulE family protein [Candidatus Electrothrix aestuarii]|uniref:GspE/PulE family protein n=1 Tax=Candidatus Electrothrix aestuarii TaxID=3062594 RepID=A0AAU8M080_9BACT|nr:GspE/PulE family protein [Candidatus Electrothrix aestuarii]
MGLLKSDKLLDLLISQRLLTVKQKQFVLRHKERQTQQLIKLQGGHKEAGRGYPDMVDILASLKLEIPGNKQRILSEELIMRAVGRKLGIPFKKLDPLELDIEIVTKTIPRSFAINHLILPFEVRNGVLQVVTYDPDNKAPLQDIEQVNQTELKPYLSTRSDIKKILSEFFGFQRSITAAESQFSSGGGSSTVDIGNLEQYVKLSSAQELSSTDQHIKAAVNHLFNYALEQRASDIHVEPKRESCLIRYRIDGVLHTIYKLPKAVHSAITSRIKALARLDIAEKRRPQDGRIKIGQKDGKEAELRVSTIPVSFGEKTVMRILDTNVIFQDLDELGFSQRDKAVYNSFITAPHGIVLVTGPTGSGKSTTLYSTLKKIASPEINIITVEDPVEMVHEDFNQISVQPLIDVTFSTILRNILRQDPDVIMIGEIRDYDTAIHAVQAALTGHLVFSTLHTNDAVSTIVRLQDLGLEPFLIGSTMLGALAQRLVRKICPHCIESYQADTEELQKMGFPVQSGHGTIELKRGKGCKECRKTGYAGRMGVFEVFPLTDKIKKMVADKATDAELRQVAIREGMTTLNEDAWQKVRNGLTTVEEALRISGDM